ncbi:PREDICTED: calcitonin receptor-like [Branchiostoma belcheri]|uniref:Calcitonin receptor-like n=1 Tax=Branchiostoma belcheri TaxID=7741 RepID=A0A6P4ZJF4_BRABE|nr:PREDICTED: calcitonin receptor-like [Branchiostoma belcheri]
MLREGMESLGNRSVTVHPRYFERLLLLTSQKACAEYFLGDNPPKGSYCNGTWDNIYCWPPTPAGYDIYMPCPEHLFFDGTKVLAYRVCNDRGEWELKNWTNYTACINYPIPPDVPLLFAVRDIYFVGSSISLVLLAATFFIFCYFRRLQCDRIKIHKHLVLSLILRFIVLIVLLQPYLGINGYDNSYLNSPFICRSMLVLSQYFSMTNVFWMLIEGLFLYMRCVVAVFHYISSLKVFYIIGWVVPVCFVVAWTVVMALYDKHQCWLDYSDLPYAWIVSGPIVLALLVNLYVLLHILAVLVTKLNADQRVPNYSEHLKALKALFVLLPLLGLTNVLFFVNPKDGGIGDHIFQVFNAVIQSSQGIFVSLIYCFTNAEVQAVIRDKLAVIKMKQSVYNNGGATTKKNDYTVTSQGGTRV